jgi:tetratricopeptide (TPR) repeat protein
LSRHLRTLSPSLIRPALVLLTVASLTGCAGFDFPGSRRGAADPLTVSRALGQVDATRDASLRLVIAGLDEDTAGRPARALASYQRAVRVDSTNPFAYLALARHHLEGGSLDEASAFLGQARALFENSQSLGAAVDVWGIGLRAGIDRERGRDESANRRFDTARKLSPEIWADERLSSAELR